MMPDHDLPDPSPWVVRFANRIRKDGEILDVACGGGRHTRLFLDRGYRVVAVDRDLDRLGDLRHHPKLETVAADLEGGRWPLAGRRFAGIVVTNYLHRPLFPRLVEALEDNGTLIYETFAEGNERFGHPKNPDYLLKSGELLRRLVEPLYILSYEEIERGPPNPAVLQRVSASKNPEHWA